MTDEQITALADEAIGTVVELGSEISTALGMLRHVQQLAPHRRDVLFAQIMTVIVQHALVSAGMMGLPTTTDWAPHARLAWQITDAALEADPFVDDQPTKEIPS